MIHTNWLKDLRNEFAEHLDNLALSNVMPGLELLNADVFVKRSWVPEIEREKLSLRELHVFPVSRSVGTASRGCKLRKATMGVMLVTPMNQGQEDDMTEASQSIGDELERLLNTRIGGFAITGVEQQQIVDHEEWRKYRKLSVTYLISFEAIAT